MAGPMLSPITVAAVETIGISAPPIDSWRFPTWTLSLSSGVPAASAAPPNSRCTSPRMIFWAPSTSPASTIAPIWARCCSVNDTPDLVRAVMPLIGSFSALPSWIAEEDMSLPRAVDMSRAAWVAWSKTSLPFPAAFRMFVKVNSRLAPD